VAGGGGDPNEGDRRGATGSAGLFKCAFNIFMGNVASGVFLLPNFYRYAGYVMSPIIGLVLGSIVVDCSRLLLRAKTMVNRGSVSDYLQLCGFVLGKPFQCVFLLALLLTQLGFCVVYLQLFGGTIARLAATFPGAEYIWMTFMFVVVLPMTFFGHNSAFLLVISIISAVSMIFAMIVTMALALHMIRERGVEVTEQAWGNDIPFGWFTNAASTMMLLGGIAAVLPVENSCKKRPSFPRVLTLVLYSVVGLYLLYGLVVSLATGPELHVLMLAQFAELAELPLYLAARMAYMLNILCSYPILFTPAVLQLDSLLGCRPRSSKGVLTRIAANLVVCAVAMGAGTGTVFFVAPLIGALPAAVILLLLPALLSLFVESSVEDPAEPRMTREYWRRSLFGRRCTLIRARAYVYLLLGALIMALGTLGVVKALVR
ncbi:amino acid transporter, partial [Trypanosoma conorhini]